VRGRLFEAVSVEAARVHERERQHRVGAGDGAVGLDVGGEVDVHGLVWGELGATCAGACFVARFGGVERWLMFAAAARGMLARSVAPLQTGPVGSWRSRF